jgi:hypothetical protein
MGAQLEVAVLDSGLSVLDTLTSDIVMCSSEPTTYAWASTAHLLDFKGWGARKVFGAHTDASPNGRKVSSAAITDGTITTSDTASW